MSIDTINSGVGEWEWVLKKILAACLLIACSSKYSSSISVAMLDLDVWQGMVKLERK